MHLGESGDAKIYAELGIGIADLATGWVPWLSVPRSIYELVSGRDAFTNKDLPDLELAARVLDVATAGFGGKLVKGSDAVATDGKRIFAQVTSSLLLHAIANGKLDSLRQFVDPNKAHIVLFCSCDAPSVQDGIQIFPVKEVFRTLNRIVWGQQFLRGIA